MGFNKKYVKNIAVIKKSTSFASVNEMRPQFFTKVKELTFN
jgi:hypothetical protein